MRHGYYDGATGVTIDLIFGKTDDNVAIITRIEVHKKFRGNGYASRMMERVCEDADEEGYLLLLSIEPDGTGLTFEQLREWYERMGFVEHRESGAMERLPRKGWPGGTAGILADPDRQWGDPV